MLQIKAGIFLSAFKVKQYMPDSATTF